MQFRVALIGFSLVSFSLLVSGCGGAGNNGQVQPDPNLRFLNGGPDSTRLDFYVDDTAQAVNLNFLALSEKSTTLPGDHDVTVQETGTTVQLDAVAHTFNSGTNSFIVAVGLENFGIEFEKRIRNVFFTSDLSAPNGSKSRLIIVQGFNRASGFATPSVDFKAPGDNVANPVTNIAFASTRTVDIDSGVQEYVVQRNASAQVYIDQTFNFVAGKIYIALIDGVEGGSGTLSPQIQYILVN